jgi:hypothetical protein
MSAEPPSDPSTAAWLLTASLLLVAGLWPCAAPLPEACPAPRVLDPGPGPGASPLVACGTQGGRSLDGALPLLFGGRLDLARADASALDVLPGIGPALAARIVAEREEAPFCEVAELGRVRGIGPRSLERLRAWLEAGADPRCPWLSRRGRGP